MRKEYYLITVSIDGTLSKFTVVCGNYDNAVSYFENWILEYMKERELSGTVDEDIEEENLYLYYTYTDKRSGETYDFGLDRTGLTMV